MRILEVDRNCRLLTIIIKAFDRNTYLRKKINMKSGSSTVLIDNYFGLLNSLSRENKIRLIAKLSNSIVNKDSDKDNPVDKLFGAFSSNKSAEDLIKDIKDSRTFNRTIEAF